MNKWPWTRKKSYQLGRPVRPLKPEQLWTPAILAGPLIRLSSRALLNSRNGSQASTSVSTSELIAIAPSTIRPSNGTYRAMNSSHACILDLEFDLSTITMAAAVLALVNNDFHVNHGRNLPRIPATVAHTPAPTWLPLNPCWKRTLLPMLRLSQPFN